MQDYLEDLLVEPEDYDADEFYGDAIESDIHEEDELDECSTF